MIIREGRIRHYYIKITDNVNVYLEDEFLVDYQSVNTDNDIEARLYVIDYDGKYELKVCTERMIELGGIE